MDTTFDKLVTTDAQSGLIVTRGIPLSSFISENVMNTSNEEFILDLSQRSTTTTTEIINKNHSIDIIDNWENNSTYNYTDSIDDDLNRILIINNDNKLNIEQSLTDQLKHHSIQEDSLSDSSNRNQSKLDLYYSTKKTHSSSNRIIIIHELKPCLNISQLNSTNFLWSKYLSYIGERSVSDEFFDHYSASIESGFEINMQLEYCYDIQHDLYWLTQIQLVSHSLILLHYVGLPDDDTSNDFWAYIYGQRCHPIGWCKENSKLMLPPPIVTKRAIQQTTTTTTLHNNHTILNGNEKQLNMIKGDTTNINQTPPTYLFDKEIGLNPSEQLKKGMLLELQDINRPWTLWFVRIINNRGGRLHLRYITNITEDEEEDSSLDIHIFYLDRRVHFIGWQSNNSSIFFYDIPICLKLITIDKEKLIDICLNQSKKQFLPLNLFKAQEEIIKHRFNEGMKLEIFESNKQNIHIGRIGHIHNDYYFDIIIDNDDDNNTNELSFIGYSTHPHILPAHWAAEHKLALMNGKSIRQTEDYWNLYTEKNGIENLAPERCFNLITLNAAGNNRVEPGMKMEMIYTLNNKDYVFSVTLIHVADHLMWLRIDDTSLFNDDKLFYHVLPINSLDVFPVGWAKFNGFDLITPIQYQTIIKTYEQNRYDLFSSVTHYPKIPRVYLNEVYLLTIYVNIECFCGPHFCSSRLTRIPSKFGPGPYRHVLIDMFHYLLSALSTNAHRALRRLDHQINSEIISNMKTEYIKAAKRSSKLIRPISIPNEPRSIYHYLRHICIQLEACPNLFSIIRIDNHCPDKCHILTNTFAFSTHSKHKRSQLRAAQNRYRKQKSLLCHLKNTSITSNISSPVVEELPTTDIQTTIINTNDILPTIPIPLPGCDRQTRGFRFHIERKTHTITRTNKKQKLINTNDTSTINIKQEPIEINNITSEVVSSSSTNHSIKESKRSCISKKRRCASPSIVCRSASPVTLNILSSNSNPSSPSNKNKKKRTTLSTSQSLNDLNNCSNILKPNIESQNSSSSSSSSFIRPIQQYSIPPPIDPRNPVTWNVNDVCWYLNESGCSFALKTIKEQEIDGAALLLLDDLNTVQDLLEFKLGPAVKFCHVVEQLRTQVIDTFHSSPPLKTSSRLSTN
ncbi:unnamed protein product [Rotaria sordida]|uniref:SLED domain-containing protein n=1 Tax=Rotaria sordida TaxID=392033 RepID=A0A819L2Y0_9BILA|nr:unnamed protein product [Rotaria sordida]CAF3957186.1 unnamed protein product [Rotaria sordida]